MDFRFFLNLSFDPLSTYLHKHQIIAKAITWCFFVSQKIFSKFF